MMDRDTLEALLKSRDDCIDILIDKVSSLLSHSFITSQQTKFITKLKSAVDPGECVVLPSCVKNYSFGMEDSWSM